MEGVSQAARVFGLMFKILDSFNRIVVELSSEGLTWTRGGGGDINRKVDNRSPLFSRFEISKALGKKGDEIYRRHQHGREGSLPTTSPNKHIT